MIEHLASLVAEQIWQLAAQGLGAASAGQLLAMFTGCTTWHWTLDSEWTHTGLWTVNNNCVHSEH